MLGVIVVLAVAYACDGGGLPALVPGVARAQALLGSVVITVGNSGEHYGFASGRYGSLVRGEFPAELFGNEAARAVEAVYEDDDGHWYFVYSGGTADDWIDGEELREVQVDVEYEGGVDNLTFVFADRIVSDSERTWKVDPPLPPDSRHWKSRSGQQVTFYFSYHRSEVLTAALPSPLVSPSAQADTLGGLLALSPGGPVVTQMLTTALVFVLLLKGYPDRDPRKPVIMLAALVVTPWAPAAFGHGSVMLATLMGIIIVLAWFLWRVTSRPVR